MNSVAKAWTGAVVAAHSLMLWTLVHDYQDFTSVPAYELAFLVPGARWIWTAISLTIVVTGVAGTVGPPVFRWVAWGLTAPLHVTFATSLFLLGTTPLAGTMWLLVAVACYCALALAVRGAFDEEL